MLPFFKTNQYEDDPDVCLMLRVKQGDNRAFDDILTKHHQRIYHFCYRFLCAE